MRDDKKFSIEKLFVEIIDGGEDELFLSRSRTGIFSPALVMWLEINRRIGGGSSLVSALESIKEGGANEVLARNRNARTQRKMSLNSGGICKARQRLKVDQVEKVCHLISDELLKKAGDAKWHGKRAYLLDGTNFTLGRSDKTFAKYAPVTNQYRSSGTSQMICACVHDLFTGVALSPAFGAYAGKNAVGETTLGKKMLNRLRQPGVVVADAGFGTFGMVWTARQHKHDVLVRLSSTRAGAIRGKKVGIEDFDEAAVWHAGNLSNHPEIPSDSVVEGRIIRRTIFRDGFRPLTLLFFTTLHEPVEELLELYLQRERIENDVRSLKYTLGLEMLSAKSPDVIEKELLLGFAANNLVRSIAAFAAQKLNIETRRISFTRAVSCTKILGNKLRYAKTAKEQNALVDDLIIALNQTKLPNRKKRRLEPRKVARHRKQFPLMKKSRQEERGYAEKIAKTYGHRGYFTTVSRKP